MPENYIWVPVGDDEEIEQFARSLSRYVHFFKGWTLPRTDGSRPVACEKNRDWGQLAAYDKLTVLAHGDPTSTEQVGWKTTAGVVRWRYDQLAAAIDAALTPGQRGSHIQYELMMRWSADSHFFKEAFASRVATELGRLGVNGQVIGYKGSVVMAGTCPSVMVQGSGRFTSALGATASAKRAQGLFRPTAADPLHVDKFNHSDFAKQHVTYPIP
jgi:hypothetical protein